MDKNINITKEYLHSILDYDSSTGIFTWKYREGISNRTNGSKAGKKAGCISVQGYVVIRIDSKLYRANRLAWIYIYNEIPNKYIDHINGIKSDNRIQNLRVATASQNSSNSKVHKDNKSKYKGVYFDKSKDKYKARIMHNGKSMYLGLFNTAEEAYKKYTEQALLINGEYASKKGELV